MQSAVEIGETKLTVPNGIMGFDLVPINKFSMSKEGARQLYKAYKYKKLKAQETDLSAGRIHSHLEEILSVKGWSYAEIVGH
jgi:hypothetical protein